MKTISLLILLVICAPVAAALTAKVLLVKGKVSKLSPGSLSATPVKRGEVLEEETSIVTKEKSFVRLKFSDNSTMNVAPKSMVVISKMPKDKANVVKLFTGMVKSEVEKSKMKTSNKLLVKTSNAVLGVRGTKFQAMYNPKNKTTSLITVEGEVAMVKQKTNYLETNDIASESLSEVDKLDHAFDNAKDVIEVPAGQYTGVGEANAKPIEPVKIAPEQFNAIAKSMGSEKKAAEVMKVESREALNQAQLGKVKAGGFVDFSTGLYVPPGEKAKIDKKTGTFTAPQMGKIDPNSGDFIPPKGVRVDDKEGLVIDQKEMALIASKDQIKLKKQVAEIKKEEGAVALVVNKNKAVVKPARSWDWLPDSILSVNFLPFSEVLTVKNKNSRSEADFYTKSANRFTLTWQQVWNERWSTHLTTGDTSYNIDDSEVEVRTYGNQSKGEYFAIGLLYSGVNKWSFGFDIVDRKEFYVFPSFDEKVEFRNSSLGLLDLSVYYQFDSLYGVDLRGGLTLHNASESGIPSENGYEEKGEVSGLTFALKGKYQWKKNVSLNPSLVYHQMSASSSGFEFRRKSLGLGFDLVWDI